jgi:hypothetical protein
MSTLSRNPMFSGDTGNAKSYSYSLISNPAVLAYLPAPSNLKKMSISMAVELPYAILGKENGTFIAYSTSGGVLEADAAIEMAVRMINNSTSILPDFKIDIVRINSFDAAYLTDSQFFKLNETQFLKSAGYAMDSVNTLMSNFTQENLSPSKLIHSSEFYSTDNIILSHSCTR